MKEHIIKKPERILIVKLSAIGDVLMATPVAAALRKAFPDSFIAWVVERKSADVVLGNPYLDEVIVWDRVKDGGVLTSAVRAASGIMSLRHDLRALKFDVCLDMQGLLRSAAVCVASGAKMRLGFSDAGEGGSFLYNRKLTPDPGNLNAQQRNLDLLKLIGVESEDRTMLMPLQPADRDFASGFYRAVDLDSDKTVVFLPATTWVNKHWTEEGWSALADILAEKYGLRALIMGSKADIPLAQRISDNCRHKPVIAAGKTSLKQAGALMERGRVVVGVDTGLLHMAVALDKPSIGLFGASVWRCFLEKENFVWVSKAFDCSPCLRHPTCANVDCMAAITPEDIEAAVGRLLA